MATPFRVFSVFRGLRKKNIIKEIFRTAMIRLTRLALLGGIVALAAWWSIPDYQASLDYSDAVVNICDRDGRPLRAVVENSEVVCDPIPLEQMGKWTPLAVVAFEDKRFFEHGGVDAVAMCRAMAQNVHRGHVVSGASTLSTLVVKLTEPRERTIWTKLVEANHAFELEDQLTKEEILEQYLNRAPFGGNIYGIEAASRRYFGKPANALSLAESAMLVGLPQSPSTLRPDRHWDAALKRRNTVLWRMLENEMITRKQYDTAKEQTMTLRQQDLPFSAPHFCDYVQQRYPLDSDLRTTLDAELQQLAEEALRQRVMELAPAGVRGGAVVMIDVHTGDLLAMVGSPDFWNVSASGQVNGTVASRSPGSTLKPFAYAAAMDQGFCTPATVMADVPMHFAGYTPQNYSLNYSGPVSVRRALVQSLNIPALECVDQVGLESFISTLHELGFSTIQRSAQNYGLGIVVGGCEATLLDLSNAYACLARGGIWKPLRLLQKETPTEQRSIFSPESAFMIADILSGDERSSDLIGHMADAVLPRVAWKTGTSSGHRDAWAIAYNPDYVVGVWLGNPDGSASDALTGGSAAGPVVGKIFRQLYPDGNAPWYEMPSGLKTRTVCARSGSVPCAKCAATVEDYYIPRITSVAPCSIHRNGEEIWPAPIQAFLEKRGMTETRKTAVTDLKLVSPVDGETFRLLPASPGIRQEIKLAAAARSSDTLYWFIDNQLLQSADAAQSIFWPLEKGAHTIACADANGRTARVNILVE
ncbi:MAG: penicillin-binding protein 1C [Pontiellaceae bacterium]|nr:penicillin-binding protein 1C [Pontiellaceae bacterium]